MKIKHLMKPDTRKKRELSKKEQISELESRRDFLIDHGFVNRAKAIENQIRGLKREVEGIRRSY